jgi:hypothetical protein
MDTGGIDMKCLLLVALAMGLAGGAMAADMAGGPPVFATQGKVAATLKGNPVAGVAQFGRQTVVFERTDLSKLAEKANADIGHRGKGDHELDWICLTDSNSQTRLWITSSSLGAGIVDGLTLAYLPHVQPTDGCPELPADWRKISLPNGLALGMTGDSLKAKVGTPSYDKAGLVGFVYASRIVEGGSRSAAVWAAVDNGKVGLLGLTQFTNPD